MRLSAFALLAGGPRRGAARSRATEELMMPGTFRDELLQQPAHRGSRASSTDRRMGPVSSAQDSSPRGDRAR